jgi:hypothetical protein
VSNTSESLRREKFQSFLKRYHAELAVPLLLDVDSIDSLTIGVKISIAPLDERLLNIFFALFRRLPFTLPRMTIFDSHGIEPRRCWCAVDVAIVVVSVEVVDDDITG